MAGGRCRGHRGVSSAALEEGEKGTTSSVLGRSEEEN